LQIGGTVAKVTDRRLMVQFRCSVVTSDAGLLAYRKLDDVLGLSAMAIKTLADARTGNNGRHALAGLFRQSVFGRPSARGENAPRLVDSGEIGHDGHLLMDCPAPVPLRRLDAEPRITGRWRQN
jgi:hypothetical protein